MSLPVMAGAIDLDWISVILVKPISWIALRVFSDKFKDSKDEFTTFEDSLVPLKYEYDLIAITLTFKMINYI